MTMKLTINSKPDKPLRGTIEVPGDKSISHRALILGGISEGTTNIRNLLEGEDVLSTAQILNVLGVRTHKMGSTWRVEGRGMRGLHEPTEVLNCGNSGTTMRLMTGLLAGLKISSSLTGDESLNARPMDRVIEPLRKMGAKIQEVKGPKGRLIVIKKSDDPLEGGEFRLKVASAQLKTALLLAGLTSGQKVVVHEPLKSRDHGERLIKAFGAAISTHGLKVTIDVSPRIKGQKIVVPGDFSSATFFLVAGLISRNPKTAIKIRNVGINPTRMGALEILKKMGGKIAVNNKRMICGEPVADLLVKSSQLKGVSVPKEMIPSLIDEVPILAVAASVAKGKTIFRGAEELRVKETDRIKALATELPKFGIKIKELKDGLEITGIEQPRGAVVKSYGDHRMAMSFAILGTLATGQTLIDDNDCIRTSFPNFHALAKKVGVSFNIS